MTIKIRIADFDTDYESLYVVRFAVFVDEQIDIEKLGKIGRVAVIASRRRQGVGNAIMAFIHGVAKDNALTSVWRNAQESAVPFYNRLGYRITSTGPFNEAGIPHVRMELTL